MSTSRGRSLRVVVLAAGRGKRMKSGTVKLLHPVVGRPLITYPLAAAAALRPARVVFVLGNQAGEVKRVVEDEARRLGMNRRRLGFALQRSQLGTGHALLQAEEEVGTARGDLLILSGDVPLIRTESLRRLLRQHRSAEAAVTVMTARLDDPNGYGRVIRGAGRARREIVRIIEHRDATPSQRAIQEVNGGTYAADPRRVFDAVRSGNRSNRQGEYYLTAIIEGLRSEGRRIVACLHPDPDELRGVNDRRDLAHVGSLLVGRTLDHLMKGGVTVIDPARTYVEPTVSVGRDTVLRPGVALEGRTRIGSECVLYAGTRIRDSVLGDRCEILDHCLLDGARLGSGVRVGPMAHLRPGTRLRDEVRIGNFVETKKADLGRGTKANHLTYLGDATVKERVNVGAGTITCNYDGVRKFRTVIGEGAFIGSDSQLVAPVTIGQGAYVGAGSTITENVPPGALAVARGRQTIKEGWVEERRRARGRPGRAAVARKARTRKRAR